MPYKLPLILALSLLAPAAFGQGPMPMVPTPGGPGMSPGMAMPTGAPPLDLAALLSSANAPLTIKMGDLTAGWQRVSISLPADPGNYAQIYASMMGGAGSVYYTKGTLTSIGGDQFLVAYHAPTPKIDLAALARSGGGDMPKLPKLTADTSLTLALINLHNVSSLSDIRPFNLQQEIADSAAQAALMTQELTVTTSSGTVKTSPAEKKP